MQDATNTSHSTKVKFSRIECPFDLDAIFQIQFNTSELKKVLEFILQHLGTLDKSTDQLSSTVKK